MLNLLRPYSGRVIAGVARGLSEHYGPPAALVRFLFVTAFLASPIVLLVYLFLAISMPAEAAVLSELRLPDTSDTSTPRERFERLSSILLRRTAMKGTRHPMPPQFLALLLLLLGFALELPRVEGMDFYYMHPILSGMYGTIMQYGAALFYLTVAFTFFVSEYAEAAPIQLRFPRSEVLLLDSGETKSIGGLASGISRMIDIDPAYVRVLLIFLNILTFGIVGILYLVAFWILRRKTPHPASPRAGGEEKFQNFSPLLQQGKRLGEGSGGNAIRIIVGFLFLFLAVIRISTELRLFFFNEPFFRGTVLIIAGIIFAARGLKSNSDNNRLWLIAGPAILFLGVFDFSTAIFRVQLPLAGRFEVAYLIAGLSLLYFTVVSFLGKPQRIGLALTATILLAALLIQVHVTPARFLVALVQFYDFFFPVIFAGLGLWLVMER